MDNKTLSEITLLGTGLVVGGLAGYLIGSTSTTKPPAGQDKRWMILWKITTDNITIKTKKLMGVEAFVGQFSDVEINAVDEKGRAAKVDTVEWITDNEDVAKWVDQPNFPGDKMKKRLMYGTGATGVAEVRVKVDADLDPGEGEDAQRFLEDFAAVQVKEREAVGFMMNITPPADVPETIPNTPPNEEANQPAQ